jgi:hypothetical protein
MTERIEVFVYEGGDTSLIRRPSLDAISIIALSFPITETDKLKIELLDYGHDHEAITRSIQEVITSEYGKEIPVE